MVETTHTLAAVAESADEALFHCMVCSRKLVIPKRGGAPTVIDEGDEQAVHTGSLGGIAGRLGGAVGSLSVGIAP